MTHGEEEAQTKEERKEKSHVPLHDTQLAVHFFVFFILGEGGETEGNNMRKIMKELCPNTTQRTQHNITT